MSASARSPTPTPAPSPFSYHPHAISWIALTALACALVLAGVRLSKRPGVGTEPLRAKQFVFLGSGAVCLAAAITWPVTDLAHSYSLLARIGQNLLLALAGPGFILAGLPPWLVSELTRPVAVHSTIRQLTRLPIAIVIFNVTVVGAQLPPVVRASTGSWLAHDAVDLALFAAGLVLWAPVIRIVPCARPNSSAGRAGYLFGQSLLPNFVSVAYIFARHPFYPSYAHGARLLGIQPLLDQQLAGVLAKVVGVFVLWGAAVVVLVRSSRAEESGLDPAPLTWEDVDRELRRLERRRRVVHDS